MLLNPEDAQRFIATYEQVAFSVHRLLKLAPAKQITRILFTAREQLQANPELLDQAVAHGRKQGFSLDSQALDALGQMRLDRWIYLKDLKSGSILLDHQGQEAYSVVGLTQPLAQITGQTGWVLNTALCPFKGKIICDGIMAPIAQLGPSFKRDYHQLYLKLKAHGRLHREPQTSPLWN